MIVALSMHEPPLASSLVRGLPPGIDGWFAHAFQKEPAARFASAKEMAEAFALASEGAGPAFERTMLAQQDAAFAPALLRPSTPAPTRVSPGVLRVPTPGPIAPSPLARAPSDRPSTRSSAAAPSGARLPAAAARMPDTFNGQYSTQGGPPPQGSPRGAAPLVVGLLALVSLVALGGVGVYAMRARAVAGPGPGLPGSSDAAMTASVPAVSSLPTPSFAPEPPPAIASSAPAPAASIAPSAHASTPPPHHVPPSHGSSASPPPAPKPPSNDYGL